MGEEWGCGNVVRDPCPVIRDGEETSSEMGRRGVYPLCFLKSVEGACNQWVADGWKTSVCRRLKRRDLRGRVNAVCGGAVRRGRVSSRTSITCAGVLVNDDLLHGNSNERDGDRVRGRAGLLGNVPSVPGFSPSLGRVCLYLQEEEGRTLRRTRKG